MRDIGAGCGQEVVRVLKLLERQNLKWTPGNKEAAP